jgi:hypothetical protein
VIEVIARSSPAKKLMNIRVKSVGVLLFLSSGFLFLWAGCSREPTRPSCPPPVTNENWKRLAAGNPCTRDADCRSWFCDRNICVDVFKDHWRGHECEPPPKGTRPRATSHSPKHKCGRFLCLDGRCRSCTSDVDCKSYYGGGECVLEDVRYSSTAMVCQHTPNK